MFETFILSHGYKLQYQMRFPPKKLNFMFIETFPCVYYYHPEVISLNLTIDSDGEEHRCYDQCLQGYVTHRAGGSLKLSSIGPNYVSRITL